MAKNSTVFLAIGVALLLTFAYQKYDNLTKPLPVPKLDTNAFWGPNSDTDADLSIRAQEVFYQDSTIAELNRRLNDTISLHMPLEGIAANDPHSYGLSGETLIRLVEYWRFQYMPQWPERLQLLNSVPHFQTKIQG